MLQRILSTLVLVSLCANALPATGQEPQENRKSAAQAGTNQTRGGDDKSLRSDVEKMRVLLGQMQRNVAFVSAGDTPLKHQLQLEIEMWQILIRDMESKSGTEAPEEQEPR